MGTETLEKGNFGSFERLAMGYSAKFNPARYESITKVLESLKSLLPGGRVLVSGRPEELGLTKYLVYDFLFHTGLKSQFKIKTLEGELLIQRKAAPATKVSVEGALIESLIEFWGTPKAEAALEQWKKEERITESEGVELWQSVAKIMT